MKEITNTDDSKAEKAFEVSGADDLRERETVTQLYDLFAEATDYLAHARASDSGQAHARARVRVCSLLSHLRPYLQDTEYWTHESVGTYTPEGDDMSFRFEGLSDVLAHRDGITYQAERPGPGLSSGTRTERITQEVPLNVLENALTLVHMWMRDVGLGIQLEESSDNTLHLRR
jgi:hypothetical protein